MSASHFAVLEPEAEDEADGWEIVDPLAARGGRRRASADTPYTVLKANDEVPDDLVMGCLSKDCHAHFEEGSERHRCSYCKLIFCDRHVRLFPVKIQRPRFYSSDSRGTSSISVPDRSLPLLGECLGLPIDRPDPLVLCSDCQAIVLPTTRAAAAQGPATAPTAALADGATATASDAGAQGDDAAEVPSGPIDIFALLSEAAELRALPLAGLLEATPEEPLRAVARSLLRRLLDRLQVCLWPWTEYEREWLWRLRDELCEAEPSWLTQFARQLRWDSVEEVTGLSCMIERLHAKQQLAARDALQIVSVLGRHSAQAAEALGKQQLGLVATHAADAIAKLPETELACVLELLLLAAHAFGAAEAIGGRRAILQLLVRAACRDSGAAAALRGELFWALEARSKAKSSAWAGMALQDLLRSLPSRDMELELLRQHAWVRHLERGEAVAARVELWGEERAFPLAVWPSDRRCLGVEGEPRAAASKAAPLIIRCRWQSAAPLEVMPADQEPGEASPASSTPASATQEAVAGGAGLLLKRDAGMNLELLVGQTLRLLELLIWEDPDLQRLLSKNHLTTEDVRVTYTIAMTGPGTAIVEFVEGAKTLRDVRAGRGQDGAPRSSLRERILPPADRGTLLSYLKQNNSKEDLKKALSRLAFTSAVSAVLSFVAGLGDRHHENFMATVDGRLLHVDYGYALGREPLDSVLIHLAVTGGRPATLLQYEELMEALDPKRLQQIFWPTVRIAYLRVRAHAGLFSELVFASMAADPSQRDPRGDPAASQRTWAKTQSFVARRCAPTISKNGAQQFVYKFLRHCARHEEGARLRDGIKGFVRRGSLEATSAAKGIAAGLLEGVRGLLAESTGLLDSREDDQ